MTFLLVCYEDYQKRQIKMVTCCHHKTFKIDRSVTGVVLLNF